MALKGESMAVEEIPPNELSSFITERVYHSSDKERRQRRFTRQIHPVVSEKQLAKMSHTLNEPQH